MTILNLLLVAAAGQLPVAAVTPPGSDRAVLDAFRTVCEKVGDYEQMRSGALAAGWQPVDASSNAQLAQIERVGREAVGDEGRMRGAFFSQQVRGRTVYLAVSRWEGAKADMAGNGCRLYDFTAVAPIDPALLQSWMGREPTGNQLFGAAGSNRSWEPGWRDGMTVSVNHVPASSPFRQRYGLCGNVFVAQALGGN